MNFRIIFCVGGKNWEVFADSVVTAKVLMGVLASGGLQVESAELWQRFSDGTERKISHF